MTPEHVIIPCARCGAHNRVPRDRMSDRPICARCKAPLPMGAPHFSGPAAVTDASFAAEALSGLLPVLVDCWAPWCGPCRTVAPVLDELSEKWSGRLKILKLNVDENPATASQYGIQSIPTLLLFRDGREIDRKVGAFPKTHLEQWLKSRL